MSNNNLSQKGKEKQSIQIQQRRTPSLDILRIILCIGVVFHHFTPERPASGPFMVLGFFVMSGFLTGIHFHSRNELNANQFYQHKIKRLFPLFLAALITGIFLNIIQCFYLHPGETGILPHMSTNQWVHLNIAQLVGYYNAPLWFMIIEFYLLICVPLLFWFYHKKWALPGLLLISMLTSFFLYQQVPYCSDHGCGLYYSPIARSWQFIAGLVAAKALLTLSPGNAVRRQFANFACIIMTLIFLTAGVWSMIVKQAEDLHFWNYTFDFDFTVVGMFCVLVPLLYSRSWNTNDKLSRILSYLALLTYPIYLFHVPVFIVCSGIQKRLLPDYAELSVLTAVIISIIVSDIALRLQRKYIG